MNIKQAHQIPIKTILESFSLFPSKENNAQTAFYFAVDRVEKTPSLSVNFLVHDKSFKILKINNIKY